MGLMCFWGSCTKEQTVAPVNQQVSMELHPYVSGYEDVPTSRAWLPPEEPEVYSLVEGTEDNSIGICFTQNDQEPQTGYFFKSAGKWRSSVEISDAARYYLYGYAPHTTGMSCEISSTSTPSDNSAYSNGAVLTIKNISAVTTNDVCVLVGAKNGIGNGYSESEDFKISGLVPGQFAYDAQTMGAGGGNYAFLLFDHLFSALRLNFNVNAEYAAWRTIKLKELRLKTYTTPDDETSVNTEKYNVTIKLSKTDDGTSPINDITYTSTGTADADGTAFYTSKSGRELLIEPSYETFVAHFVPAQVRQIVLISTYDVYDRKGNLVRENCEAKNSIKLNLFSGQTETFRGGRYTINLTVNPTYLYVMSEDELDNPTMVIKGDD